MADEAIVTLVVVADEDRRGDLAMNPAFGSERRGADEPAEHPRLVPDEQRAFEPGSMAYFDILFEDHGAIPNVEDDTRLDRLGSDRSPAPRRR